MTSSFQVITSVWLPDRLTAAFAARVNTRLVVAVLVASAADVATAVKALLESVPVTPVPLLHVEAFQDTSPAAQVVAPETGGVKLAALACNDTLSWLAAAPI